MTIQKTGNPARQLTTNSGTDDIHPAVIADLRPLWHYSRMPRVGFVRDLVRSRDGDDAHKVTFVELFFDLVFVFAVTQVSHGLIAHPSAEMIVETLILTFAVWWMWLGTAWVTNWLNPERGRVRSLLIAMMFGALLMSSAIPQAFGDKALLFAISYVTIQIGRSLFAVFAFSRHNAERFFGFVRISVWSATSGVLWIGGALAPHEVRVWVWLGAVAIDFTGPIMRFFVPGLGGSAPSGWNISGQHMAERVSLFLIIALGESIIVTGSTFSQLPIDPVHISSFLAAFTGTVLMWLLYFSHAQSTGREYIAQATDNRGQIARAAYSYIPTLFVAGIVLAAVGDALLLTRPTGPAVAWTAAIVAGSSAVYLVGNALFVHSIGGPWLVTHLVGIATLVVVGVAFVWANVLLIAWLTNAVLLAVVVGEEVLHWHRQRTNVDDGTITIDDDTADDPSGTSL